MPQPHITNSSKIVILIIIYTVIRIGATCGSNHWVHFAITKFKINLCRSPPCNSTLLRVNILGAHEATIPLESNTYRSPILVLNNSVASQQAKNIVVLVDILEQSTVQKSLTPIGIPGPDARIWQKKITYKLMNTPRTKVEKDYKIKLGNGQFGVIRVEFEIQIKKSSCISDRISTSSTINKNTSTMRLRYNRNVNARKSRSNNCTSCGSFESCPTTIGTNASPIKVINLEFENDVTASQSVKNPEVLEKICDGLAYLTTQKTYHSQVTKTGETFLSVKIYDKIQRRSKREAVDQIENVIKSFLETNPITITFANGETAKLVGQRPKENHTVLVVVCVTALVITFGLLTLAGVLIWMKYKRSKEEKKNVEVKQKIVQIVTKVEEPPKKEIVKGPPSPPPKNYPDRVPSPKTSISSIGKKSKSTIEIKSDGPGKVQEKPSLTSLGTISVERTDKLAKMFTSNQLKGGLMKAASRPPTVKSDKSAEIKTAEVKTNDTQEDEEVKTNTPVSNSDVVNYYVLLDKK